MTMVYVGHIATYRQLTAQVGWLAWSEGRRPSGAAYICQMNRVNSCNDESWWQHHKHCPVYYYYYYYYYYYVGLMSLTHLMWWATQGVLCYGCRQCSECVKAADVNDNDTDSSQPRRLRHKTLIREPVKYASTYLQPLRMVMTACDVHAVFHSSSCPPLGLVWTMMLVWRKGNINRTVSVL